MLRVLISLVAIVTFCSASLLADDKKDTTKAGQGTKATITNVDAKNKTITVRMKDKDGKDVERTFKLTEDVRMLDSNGKAAAIDVFRSGNDVLVIEREGRLREIHQNKPK
jgi:hypothetical protein